MVVVVGKEKKKKLVLYVGHDIAELQIINKLVPELVGMGITPVLAMVGKRPYKNPNSETEAMQELGFYHGDLLSKVVIPFLDDNPPHLDPQGKLKPNICYTPKQLAEHYDLEIDYVADVNAKEHIAKIRKDKEISGGLSVRCTHIFQQPIINVFQKKGFLWNIHPGKLPNIRGVLPVFRALQRNDRSIEWTLHSIIDNTVDTGPVHNATSQPADFSKRSVFMHYNENAAGVSAMVLGTLQDVLDGVSIKRMVSRRKVKLETFPTSEETDAFNRAGGALVEPRGKMIDYIGRVFAGNGSPYRRELEFLVEKAIKERFDPPPGGKGIIQAFRPMRPSNDQHPESFPEPKAAGMR